MVHSTIVVSVLGLASTAAPLAAAADASIDAWPESEERRLLEQLTLGSDRVDVSIERLGRWRFDEIAPSEALPLSEQVLSSGRRQGPDGSEMFSLTTARGSWALTRASHKDEPTQGYLWSDARQHSITRVPDPDKLDSHAYQVVVVSSSKVRPNPFMLHKLGYLLLARGFPADAARVEPNFSLLETLDQSSLAKISSTSPDSTLWAGSLESRGRAYGVTRTYEVAFGTSDSGEHELRELRMSYAATNPAGDVIRRYSDMTVRFGDGWTARDSLDSANRRMQVIEVIYDDQGSIAYSMYSEYRVVAAESQETHPREPLDFGFLLRAVGIDEEEGASVQIADLAMGLQYVLGSKFIRFEGTVHELNEPISGLLTPREWVSLARRHDWGPK